MLYNYNMRCKYLENGIAIGYNHIVKPCCGWKISPEWRQQNHLSKVDLANWHQSEQIQNLIEKLDKDEWPDACAKCKYFENLGRGDSFRENSNSEFGHLKGDDITLEITPGNVCNFSCQTCWPEASSKVTQAHQRAGFIDIKNVDSSPITDFDFLLPIAARIKNVTLLGGEPFYDKNCIKFLKWALDNLNAKIIMFTNGSAVDWDWVDAYPGKIIIAFSLDAIGKPAEYIRQGTVWNEVYDNFLRALSHPKVETRVSITCSIYNYYYINDLIELLIPIWPTVVTFARPDPLYLNEMAVPVQFRETLIKKLAKTMFLLNKSNIEKGQKATAVGALRSIITNLNSTPYDDAVFRQWKDYVLRLDRAKNINVADYCEFTQQMLLAGPVEIPTKV